MFRDDIERTIGTVLKANGHKMTELGRGCIYYMKRFSPELAYYIRCSDNRSSQGDISFELFFTVVDVPCDVFLTFGVGLHVKILSIYEGVAYDFMSTNEIITNAGEKIIGIENSIGGLAPVILDELEKPYYMNKKIPHYRLEREIYRQVEGDERVRSEFDTLKKEMCRIIKHGGNRKPRQLVMDFSAGLSDACFKGRGIDLEFSEIQEMFYQHLYAECILDM